MTTDAPTHFESDWGRYRVHRADGDRLVLEDLANPGAYVTPTAEQLAASYRPFTPRTPRPKRPRDVASGSGPVAQIAPSPSGRAAASDGGVSADGGESTFPATGVREYVSTPVLDWSPPRANVEIELVLGAVPARGTHFNPTVPAEADATIVNVLAPALAPYWIPCFTRSAVEPGEPHAYFIFDGTSFKCEMCRPPAPPRRAYEIPPPLTDEERVSIAHAFWRLAQMRGGRSNIAPKPAAARPTSTPVTQPAPAPAAPAKPKQGYPPCNGCKQIKIIMILMRPMRQGEPWWSLCSRCYRGASLEVQAHAV